MATLVQLYNARHSADLRVRAESAILKASKGVQIEDVGVTNHAERLLCANACLCDESYLQKIVNAMMFEVGTNDTIANNVTAALDSDIQWVVDSAFTAMSVQLPPA